MTNNNKKITIIKNWRAVLIRAFSVRFLLLASIFSGLEAALPFIDEFVSIPRGLFAIMTFVSVAGGLITRFIVQEHLYEKPKEDTPNV